MRGAARYMVVFPFGGLNDTLCQVAFALQTARETQRRLVISLEKSAACMDRFDDVFELENPGVDVISHLSPELKAELDRLEAYPRVFQGDVRCLGLPYLYAGGGYTRHGQPMTLTKCIAEDGEEARRALRDVPVLVHAACGSTPMPTRLELLRCLRLRQGFVDRFRPLFESATRALATLGKFVSVHVRFSDLKCGDFEELLRDWHGRATADGKGLLVCSDGREVLDFVQQLPGGAAVSSEELLAVRLPLDAKDGLHVSMSRQGGDAMLRACAHTLVDLFLLSHGDPCVKTVGGFGILAQILAKHADVRDRLFAPLLPPPPLPLS